MNNIDKIATALYKAQAVMPPAKMNATNPFLKNKYADLGSVIEASREPLADNELSVTQLVTGDESRVTVETILMHSSGQSISARMSLALGEEKGKSAAQVAGSIITYLRRYSLAAMLGIYADEDTDGNGGEVKKESPRKQKEAPVEQPHASMTLETALEVKNSKGESYGTIDSETLSNMTIGIDKGLKKANLTPEKRDEYYMKLDAIKLILASRT